MMDIIDYTEKKYFVFIYMCVSVLSDTSMWFEIHD